MYIGQKQQRRRKFIEELINTIAKLNTENISNKEMLEQIVQTLANEIDRLWLKHSKVINITRHSKA